ncbi:MAG: DUF952 domain-containing protein [Hyphomonadaceae bacterium]|nr:DUF952 domain-containing protein [Hyphomonadaceae bacterium]
MTNIIYKIENAKIWAKAQAAGIYHGSALDLADGYIHLSAAEHVRATAHKYMAGQAGLVLIGVDGNTVGDTLKWEPARDGALFPHIYGTLPLHAVIDTVPLPLDENGLHVFGPHIP